MDFTALQTEFYARGFDYLNDGGTGQTRTQRWINFGYEELCEEELWPFVLTNTSTSGSAPPVTIADLRKVQMVQDRNQSQRTIPWRDERDVADFYSDVTLASTPRYWYMTTQTTLTTYPVGGSLIVSYWKVPTELSAGSDVPLVPQRFQEAIVYGALRHAYLDTDNQSGAQMVEGQRQQILQRMRSSLLEETEPPHIIETSGSTDW